MGDTGVMANPRTRLTQAWTILSALVVVVLIWFAVDALLDTGNGSDQPADEPEPAAGGVTPTGAALRLDDREVPFTIECSARTDGPGYELAISSRAEVPVDYLASVEVLRPDGGLEAITIAIDDLAPGEERRVLVPTSTTIDDPTAGGCRIGAVEGDRHLLLANS